MCYCVGKIDRGGGGVWCYVGEGKNRGKVERGRGDSGYACVGLLCVGDWEWRKERKTRGRTKDDITFFSWYTSSIM